MPRGIPSTIPRKVVQIASEKTVSTSGPAAKAMRFASLANVREIMAYIPIRVRGKRIGRMINASPVHLFLACVIMENKAQLHVWIIAALSARK
jgi:hypothetical protein